MMEKELRRPTLEPCDRDVSLARQMRAKRGGAQPTCTEQELEAAIFGSSIPLHCLAEYLFCMVAAWFSKNDKAESLGKFRFSDPRKRAPLNTARSLTFGNLKRDRITGSLPKRGAQGDDETCEKH